MHETQTCHLLHLLIAPATHLPSVGDRWLAVLFISTPTFQRR